MTFSRFFSKEIANYLKTSLRCFTSVNRLPGYFCKCRIKNSCVPYSKNTIRYERNALARKIVKLRLVGSHYVSPPRSNVTPLVGGAYSDTPRNKTLRREGRTPCNPISRNFDCLFRENDSFAVDGFFGRFCSLVFGHM